MISEIKQKLSTEGKFWIVFVGDSITSGEWVHPNWREIVEYAVKQELQKLFDDYRIPSWGIRCFNCGYDGATTRDILNKTQEILDLKPDLVIMMIGENDGIMGIGTEEHKNNLENIFERFGGLELVFLTDNYPDNLIAAERYRKYVEADQGMGFGKFINLFEEFQKFNYRSLYTFKSEENPEEGLRAGDRDYWHPNQLGNAYIAKVILGEVFGVEFDPEKYIRETLAGEKYPGY